MKRRPRGSGSVYRQGPAWSIRTGTGPARRYETGFRTKAEAERRLALLRAESMQRRLGVAADPRLTPTLAALAEPWLERRKATHSAGAEDGYRWTLHLEPMLGHLRPGEVDTARLRAWAEAKRGELAPGTLRVVLATLSALYGDLLERGVADHNPCRGLPPSLLRLMRSDHDPRTVPFVARLEDVRRIYLALPEPLHVAYALGAMGGLRTGEVFSLRWTSVDLDGGTILVSEGSRTRATTKDRDPRPVPIQDALLPVLKAWRLKTGGAGLVVSKRGKRIDKHVPGPALRAALRSLELHRLAEYPDAWYAATRHSFASQWAMAGRSLRELQAILGHASITETERYAHLLPGHFAPGARAALAVDLSPGGAVAALPRAERKPLESHKRPARTRKRA
jgi:integrase